MLSKSAVSATTVVNFLICSSWFSFVLVVFLSLMAPLISVPSPGAIVLLTESAECQRAEGEAQIAQRYVEVARKYKQVENDAHEPGCDDVSENPWLDCHPDACSDLDYPHNGHKETGGNQVSNEGREVFLPVNKDVEELVGSREDRRCNEAGPKDAISLEGWVTSLCRYHRRARCSCF